ncbi:hypothetical protein ACLK19_07460 [Escherichia coli]
MALPSEEEFAERKNTGTTCAGNLCHADVPPAPTPAEPGRCCPRRRKLHRQRRQPSANGLLSRFFGALKALFSGSEETKPTSNQHRKQKRNRNVDRIVASLVRTTAVTVMARDTRSERTKATIIAKKTVVIVARRSDKLPDA